MFLLIVSFICRLLLCENLSCSRLDQVIFRIKTNSSLTDDDYDNMDEVDERSRRRKMMRTTTIMMIIMMMMSMETLYNESYKTA